MPVTSQANSPVILVVDDQQIMRLVATAALRKAGFAVEEAMDGEQALVAINERIPDLVLLDVVMPGIDGFAVCERIRCNPETNHLPVVFMTGLDDEQSIIRTYDVGATDFIGKPFSPVVLVQRVRYVLRAQRAEEGIRRLAMVDSLTEVANRASFRQHLEQVIASSERSTRLLAVLFLDLDDFKRINDTLGHNIGDLLLQGVAQRLVQTVRTSDMVASQTHAGTINRLPDQSSLVGRVGGDEFLVSLPDLHTEDDAAVVAERILEALADPFELGGQKVTASLSIGIALFPRDGTDADVLLKNADAAMYVAKRSGKNAYRFHDDDLSATAQRRITLDTHLRTALAGDEFHLHYQPVMSFSTGRIRALEALLRWENEPLGKVSPPEFIPLAERNRTIIPIGEWVLRAACAENRYLRAHGFPALQMAVNISLLQFNQLDFVDMVRQILNEFELPAEALELEITETLLAEDADSAIHTLRSLKEVGIGLAIDDFGTGFSSLSHLKHFPIDRLKIDRSFVRDIVDDPNDAAIATAVIAMAESMQLSVTAEGVETEAQMKLLRAKGCDEIQGYWLSRPLPAEEIRTFLNAHS